MLYKINLILLFIFLYFLFFKQYIINSLNSTFNSTFNQNSNIIIKFVIYNKNYITTEILNQEIETFNPFLIFLKQQFSRFEISEDITGNYISNTPSYCNLSNVDCNFPVYQIGNNYISLNNIQELIDTFDQNINNMNNQQKLNLKQQVGFDLYQFINGKLYYNNENYCNLVQGGFRQNNVKRVLPLDERCDIRENNCTFVNNRYYIETNQIENSFCNYSKNIEVEGSLYCKNNLDISFNGKLCLSIDKYIPIIILHLVDNNYNYTVDIQNFKPDNLINLVNKLENKESKDNCPNNSTNFNNICQCNTDYTCAGNNCNGNRFTLETCYNCSCNNSH